MSIISEVVFWYKGGPQPTHQKNDDGSETFRLPNTFELSLSARIAQWCVKHLMPIIAMLVAAIVALFIHFDGKPSNETHNEKTNSISQNVIHDESPISNKYNKSTNQSHQPIATFMAVINR